jgi:hypothetical protein
MPRPSTARAAVGGFPGGALKEIANDAEQGKREGKDQHGDRDSLECPGDVLHRLHD